MKPSARRLILLSFISCLVYVAASLGGSRVVPTAAAKHQGPGAVNLISAAGGRTLNFQAASAPGLEWSTFLGGSGVDVAGGVAPARDGTGDIYVAGYTNSPDFPLHSDPNFTPQQNRVYVARLNSSATTIVWATFLGGWHGQVVYRGLAVNDAGEAVVVGELTSPDFPTTPGAYDPTTNGAQDGFVFKLNSSGGLVFSTFLGGNRKDSPMAVGFDPAGNVIVGGTTSSSDFPTTVGAYDRTYSEPTNASEGDAHGDVFVTRLTPDGTQATYSTLIGGQSADVLEDMVVDPSGVVTLVGWITGHNVEVFPTTPGAFDRTWNSNQDVFLARFKPDGAGAADLKYSTLMGGLSSDNAYGVAFDPADPSRVVVAGRTWSEDFPVTPGALKTTNPPFSPLFPSESAWAARFNFPASGGGSLVWSTYFGAGPCAGEMASDVTFNSAGEVIITGLTGSWDFPTTRGAYDRTPAGTRNAPGDGFLARISSDGARLLYSTVFGGADNDQDSDRITPLLAHLGGNTVVVTGSTGSTDFHTTPGAFDRTHGNPETGLDAYLLKLTLEPDASGDLAVDAPLPRSPADGAAYDDAANQVRLEWSAVADASGVEGYHFQVSTKPDFPVDFIHYQGTTSATEAVMREPFAYGTWYWRVRAADRAGNLSAWSPTSSFTLGAAGAPPGVSDVQIYPFRVTGGQSATGVVHFSNPIPAGGAVVRLELRQSRGWTFGESRSVPLSTTVPLTLNVPAGAISYKFPITTVPVSLFTPVDIYATINNVGEWGTLEIHPPSPGDSVNSPVLNPMGVVGGNSTTGTITLRTPAPAGGMVVPLSSSHPAVAQVQPSVTIPAGASSATFTVTTSPVRFQVDAWIRAADKPAILSVKPPTGVRLVSLTLNPASTTGGSAVTGTVTFSGPVPPSVWPASDGAYVNTRSSDTSVAAMSPFVVVPSGATSATFAISPRSVPADRNVNITVSFDTVTLTAPLTVRAGPAVTLSSLTVNPNTVTAGQGGTGFVNLSAPAPAGGVVVKLSSNNAAVRVEPAELFISQGTTNSIFSFTSQSVSATTAATITGSFGASTASANVTVNPAQPSNVTLEAVSINPNSVAGGNSSTGTVTLSGPAPAGGTFIQLGTSNPSAANTAAGVTVAAGATSANFQITTSSVTTTTVVKVWAVLNYTLGAAITVTAAPAPPPTPAAPTLLSPAQGATVRQPLTLHWSDVANATSYRIQIDDASTFPSPQVVNQVVNVSQFTTSSLPAKRLWWRVRGINSAGTTGPWSAVRNFTVQANTTPPPAAPTLSTLTLNPTSVVGGNSSTGTVTLTGAAPSGGAVVTLSSSNTSAATTPASVTVAAGASSANFQITTRSVTTSTNVTVTAAYGGVTRTATLTVTPQAAPPPPPPSTDTVAIQVAEYSTGNRQLRVEATSTNSGATLRVHVTSTNELIGTLRNEGGGRYRGDFSWPTNPQNITVRSSAGGSASRAVTVK